MIAERDKMTFSPKVREGKRLPDSEAKKRWIKENTVIISVKLNRNTDTDIIKYLENVGSAAGAFKLALREYMKNHKDE